MIGATGHPELQGQQGLVAKAGLFQRRAGQHQVDIAKAQRLLTQVLFKQARHRLHPAMGRHPGQMGEQCWQQQEIEIRVAGDAKNALAGERIKLLVEQQGALQGV